MNKANQHIFQQDQSINGQLELQLSRAELVGETWCYWMDSKTDNPMRETGSTAQIKIPIKADKDSLLTLSKLDPLVIDNCLSIELLSGKSLLVSSRITSAGEYQSLWLNWRKDSSLQSMASALVDEISRVIYSSQVPR